MREKILAQLTAKFAGVSTKALGLIADKIAKKVTEESGIDDAITAFDNAVGVTDFAADLQREGDRRVSDAKKEFEKKNPTKPPKTDDDNKDDPPKDDEMPKWAKSLFETVGNLTKEKAQGSIRTKAAEKLKDVPETFWGGRSIPDKEEDLDGFVESVTKDFTAMKQTFVNEGLMNATPPAGGAGAGTGTLGEKVVDQNIKDWSAAKSNEGAGAKK